MRLVNTDGTDFSAGSRAYELQAAGEDTLGAVKRFAPEQTLGNVDDNIAKAAAAAPTKDEYDKLVTAFNTLAKQFNDLVAGFEGLWNDQAAGKEVTMTDEPDVFATSVDLEQRWHKLTDEEREKADTHLADVTDYIKERSPNWQRLLDERPRLLTKITCDIVRRIMQADPYDIPGGVTQMNQTTGSFSEQYSFGAPTGDLWLRDDEKRILGINAQRAFSVDMATGETS
ncbi:MAG: Gp19/Gp15/Gp42 family protein [Bifidobacterium pseudocatenulatum]